MKKRDKILFIIELILSVIIMITTIISGHWIFSLPWIIIMIETSYAYYYKSILKKNNIEY